MPLDRPGNMAASGIVVEVCPSLHIRALYAECMSAAPVIPPPLMSRFPCAVRSVPLSRRANFEAVHLRRQWIAGWIEGFAYSRKETAGVDIL